MHIYSPLTRGAQGGVYLRFINAYYQPQYTPFMATAILIF